MRQMISILAAMALLVPSWALCAVDEEPRTAEKLAQLEEEAWNLAKDGQHQEAIDIWLDILPEISGAGLPALHKNIAHNYGKLRKLPEMWFHLVRYLETSGTRDERAGASLKKLEKKLMETHRKVVVTCSPEGATLYFGLEATGAAYTCPVTWWFKPGKRFVRVEKKDYEPQTAEYDVREQGEKGVWSVKLKKLPGFGHLVIKGEGKAIQVFLNGSLEGKVPFKRKLKEGTYELMVGKPGEMPWKKTVVIKANATVVEEPPNAQKKVAGDQLPKDQLPVASDQLPVEKRSKAGPVALLAGGLGVVVVGVILNGVGSSREGDLYDKYNPGHTADGETVAQQTADVKSAQDLYEAAYADEVQPVKAWTYVLYGVGGTAAAAGAIWLIVEATRKPEKKTGIKVSPMMGPGRAGAVFGLEF